MGEIRRTRDKNMEGTQLIDFARLATFNLKRWILRISETTSKFSMERKKGQITVGHIEVNKAQPYGPEMIGAYAVDFLDPLTLM